MTQNTSPPALEENSMVSALFVSMLTNGSIRVSSLSPEEFQVFRDLQAMEWLTRPHGARFYLTDLGRSVAERAETAAALAAVDSLRNSAWGC